MSFPAPYPGPVPPYNNVPINSQYYKPSQYFISTISLGQTTMITTTVDNNYVVGQLCRLLIPKYSGTRQLNEQQGYVISLPASNQVELSIDSSFFDPFVTSTQPTQPQILAIGDISSGNINNSGNLNTSTTIPGSYQNISPL